MRRNRDYKKKGRFRDATLIFIFCEGEKREPGYFRFFQDLSSRLILKIFPSIEGKSSPKSFMQRIDKQIKDINKEKGDYQIFIVLDKDYWEMKDIIFLYKECDLYDSWNVALSNPCFEVWLYYHFKDILPDNRDIGKPITWKNILHQCVEGGFNSDIHPELIERAIVNSYKNYSEEGFIPKVGSTQVHILGEKIFDIVQNQLNL